MKSRPGRAGIAPPSRDGRGVCETHFVGKSEEFRLYCKRIGEWASSLPDSAWIPGPPPCTDCRTMYAVKTETGRILTGCGTAFRPDNQVKIAAVPKYGPVIAHVEVGD